MILCADNVDDDDSRHLCLSAVSVYFLLLLTCLSIHVVVFFRSVTWGTCDHVMNVCRVFLSPSSSQFTIHPDLSRRFVLPVSFSHFTSFFRISLQLVRRGTLTVYKEKTLVCASHHKVNTTTMSIATCTSADLSLNAFSQNFFLTCTKLLVWTF